MSLGFLTESALLPKQAKPIEGVDSSSVSVVGPQWKLRSSPVVGSCWI